jgi:LmbE family N-acetylglucosaminyl deacetylase
MAKRCLIFAAHPDDETNGVGGTILQLITLGWKVRIVYATLPTDPEIYSLRTQACLNVGKHAGAEAVLWGLPDAGLEVTKMTQQLAQAQYDDYQPDLVLVMNPIDVHPDHRAMASLAMGPALQKGVNTEVMLYELCASGRHTDGDRPQSLGHFPTHYVDTSEVIDEVALLQEYHSTEDPEAMVIGMKRVHANRAVEWGHGDEAYMEAFMRLTRVGPLQHGLEEIFVESSHKLPRRIGVNFDPKNIGL